MLTSAEESTVDDPYTLVVDVERRDDRESARVTFGRARDQGTVDQPKPIVKDRLRVTNLYHSPHSVPAPSA
jgi:hypothetical protein